MKRLKRKKFVRAPPQVQTINIYDNLFLPFDNTNSLTFTFWRFYCPNPYGNEQTF